MSELPTPPAARHTRTHSAVVCCAVPPGRSISELTSKVSQLELDSSAVDGLREGIKGIDDAIDKVGGCCGWAWAGWWVCLKAHAGMGFC